MGKSKIKTVLGIKLHWYKGYSLMWNFVQFLINNNLFRNLGKLKEGDMVKYNWFAKVQIRSAIDPTRVLIVKEIIYKDGSGVKFTNGECCDPFWVRKLYPWEK